MLKRGLIVAFFTFLLDQFNKWYMLEIVDIDLRPTIEVTPFFNLVMIWNRGISFGMFNTSDYSVLIFSGIALTIVACLCVWLYRTKERWEAAALGFIIGGALGNVVDRIRFGAVADFFDFHVAGYHWPAFNIADSAVFIGAAMLIGNSLFNAPSEKDSHD